MTLSEPSRTADRILALDWVSSFDRTYSRVKLMSEYLRRAAWWAQATGRPDGWPFFDIAAAVDGSVRADPAVLARVTERLAQLPISATVRDTCLWAVHWSALKASSGSALPALDDPFEPLLLMYERGGEFTTSSGFIDVDGAGVPRKTWRDHLKDEPVVSLDLATLDALDAAGPPRRSDAAT